MAVQPIVRQFLMFSAVGAVGTAAHYAVLIALVHHAIAEPLTASTLAFMCGAAINYILNYIYTFSSRKRHLEAATKFYLVAVIGLMLNGVIMGIGVNLLHRHYLTVQLAATCIVLIWNFVVNRLWTFREKELVGTR